MQPDRFQAQAAARTGAGVAYDAGLRGHMQRIYNRMTAGVLVTAITAYAVATVPGLMPLLMGGPQAYLFMLAPVAVLWFGFNPMTMPARKLQMSFFLISVLYGISFSVIVAYFAKEDIARAFFLASAMFAGLSIFGYTTKKNLDGLGSFAVMGVMGVFILAIINMFVQSTMMMNMISGISIVAFAGVTAWQTQSMKEMYNPGHGEEGNSRMAWSAALNLYVSFIALFQSILNLLSNRS